MKKIWAVYLGRMREFYRDTASFAWTLCFPLFIVLSLYAIFSDRAQIQYNVAVMSEKNIGDLPDEFFHLKYVQFVASTQEEGLAWIKNNRVDFVVQVLPEKIIYWLNDSVPKAYFLERLLKASTKKAIERQGLQEKPVTYLDWVVPGVIAMNLMFACFWGVGWVIVKYRQDGFLKRLNGTPLKAWQFLLAQVLSRYVITFFITAAVFLGAKALIGFEMKGSYFALILTYSVGTMCLMSFGLLVASRTTSKEFADGILNLFSWPMMLLSEVWFSLEGSSNTVLWISKMLPLTHLVQSTRAIINEGATLMDVSDHLLVMLGVSLVLITMSSLLFKWSEK